MSNVTLAASAGFCFGVKRAIEMAYAEIEKNDGAPLYSYGSLIHNKEVTKDLDAKGLHIIESLDGIDEGTVVIRSHGVGKFLYDALEEKGMRMVDGTCPFVKKIRTIVNEAWNQGKSIIIAGDGKHPEVQGINGWCGNTAIILESPEEAKAAPRWSNGWKIVPLRCRQRMPAPCCARCLRAGRPCTRRGWCTAASARRISG